MWFLDKGAENQIGVVVLPSPWLFAEQSLQSRVHLWSLQEKRMLKIWGDQATTMTDSLVILPPSKRTCIQFIQGSAGVLDYKCQNWWRFRIRGFFFHIADNSTTWSHSWKLKPGKFRIGKKHKILALEQLTKGWACFSTIWDFKVRAACLSSAFFF